MINNIGNRIYSNIVIHLLINFILISMYLPNDMMTNYIEFNKHQKYVLFGSIDKILEY